MKKPKKSKQQQSQQPTTRTCNKCGETKPLEDFATNKECRFGRRHTCYECRMEAIAARRSPRYCECGATLVGGYQTCGGCRQAALDAKARERAAREAAREVEAQRLQLAGKKRCGACHREKVVALFGKNSPRCLSCERKRDRERDQRDPRRAHMKWDSVHRLRAIKADSLWERVTMQDLEQLYWKQGACCAICREPLTNEIGSGPEQQQQTDHIVPISHGGGHVLANLQLLHGRCHWIKSTNEATAAQQSVAVVRAIRVLGDDGYTQAAMSRFFGLGKKAVGRIVRHESWRNLRTWSPGAA